MDTTRPIPQPAVDLDLLMEQQQKAVNAARASGFDDRPSMIDAPPLALNQRGEVVVSGFDGPRLLDALRRMWGVRHQKIGGSFDHDNRRKENAVSNDELRAIVGVQLAALRRHFNQQR